MSLKTMIRLSGLAAILGGLLSRRIRISASLDQLLGAEIARTARWANRTHATSWRSVALLDCALRAATLSVGFVLAHGKLPFSNRMH